MEEIWKKIKDYPDYEISNKGRIRSVSRVIQRNGHSCNIRGKVLAATNRKGWYKSIALSNSEGKRTQKIHRLVYESFVGSIEKGYEIHHIDGDKQNNIFTNLKMVSTSEHHRLTMEEYPNICNHMIYKNKFERREIGQYTKDGRLINTFINAKVAQKVTGVCSRNICQVVNKTPYREGRIRQSAGGFIWRYIE